MLSVEYCMYSISTYESANEYKINLPGSSLASLQATHRFYLTAVEKNREKTWEHCYVTDQKR